MPKQTDMYNSIFHTNEDGQYHREDGPAIIHTCGTMFWFLNGKRHREGGLAAIYMPHETKEWYLNDRLHREDGPAVELYDGSKYWYINGKRHREDGPAIERADGTKEWYLDGNKVK
jgi:hypothetical protein